MHDSPATRVVRWGVIALGFSIPVSVAADNVLLAVVVLAWVAGGRFADRLALLRGNPVNTAALVLVVVLLLGMTWSPLGLSGLRKPLGDIVNLACLPILFTLFEDARTRERAMDAFLLASALIFAASLLLWSGLVAHIPGTKGEFGYPVVFKWHITHNFLMAVAAIFCVLRATRSQGRVRTAYLAGAGMIAFNVLFMVPGRTGQLAFAAAAFYIAFSRFGWRGLLGAAAITAAIVAVTWLLPSSVMHERAALAWQEASQWKEGSAQNNSVGLRLEFYLNALRMIAAHPLLGTGTGGFAAGYQEIVAGTGMSVAAHPHNVFLFVAGELGLVGLASLLGLLVVQWHTAGRLTDAMQCTTARALLVIYVAGGMVSATFSDHAEGLFFVWSTALLWAGLPPSRPRT